MGTKAKRRRLREQLRGSPPETHSAMAARNPGVVFHATTGPKLSDALLEAAQPFLPDASETRLFEDVFGRFVVAWNLSLLPEHERDTAILKASSRYSTEERTLMIGELTEMIARKHASKPDDRRFVADYQLRIDETAVRLSVASLPFDKRQKA